MFVVLPTEGAIPPGKSLEVAVTFQPDHASLKYQDSLRVQLLNEVSEPLLLITY